MTAVAVWDDRQRARDLAAVLRRASALEIPLSSELVAEVAVQITRLMESKHERIRAAGLRLALAALRYNLARAIAISGQQVNVSADRRQYPTMRVTFD